MNALGWQSKTFSVKRRRFLASIYLHLLATFYEKRETWTRDVCCESVGSKISNLKDKIYSTSKNFAKQASIKINLLDLLRISAFVSLLFLYVKRWSCNTRDKVGWCLARDNATRLFSRSATDRCLARARYNKIASACPLSRNKLGFVCRRRHPLCATFIHTGDRRNERRSQWRSVESRRRRHRCQIGIPDRRWQKIESNVIGEDWSRPAERYFCKYNWTDEQRQQTNREF